MRTIIVEPKRLAWAAVDKDTFEQLISRLEDLNSFLIALLDKSQLQRLQDTINTSYLELLQIRNDVGSLTDLVKALTPPVRESPAGWHPESWNYFPSRAAAEETAEETKKREYLKQLVDIKIQFAKMDQLSTNGTAGIGIREFPITPPLSLDEFRFHDGLLDPDDLPRRSNALYRGSSIWVEWKRISATENSRPAVDGVRVRISLLTDLLCRAIPTGFRAPPCLGYVENVDSNDETRFGIVFNNMAMNGSPCELISVYELLAREQKPSLTKRMALCAALARSVYAFHSVNWLHKGLRSDNIIFFASSPDCVDLTAPYVSGFELSRPSIVEGMTEKPKFDPLQDIYRHPYAQSTQTDGSYRKSYDIYSLGIILIEIALWAPIEQIVGITDLSRSKPSVLQDLRQSLLGRTSFMLEHSLPSIPGAWACLQQVDAACGELFRNVVQCCLIADEIERREYPAEPESAVALRLQRVTEWDIMKRLECIAHAL
ncbi:hypothetical protein F5Y13DRAFT_149115 [Hypoxylon sp. FL1857]|nr:hypothetical protein F5Y13DRAFT_149115 [Hypoxylon sp. FL1857]